MQATFREVVGGACELLVCACYAHMHVHSRLRMQIQSQKFHCAKKFVDKIFANACIGEIGENFLLVKISTYTVNPLSNLYSINLVHWPWTEDDRKLVF